MLTHDIGSCTSYKEKLCYHRYRVSDTAAINVSWLLSELADQPKQGITFGQQDWNRFRTDIVGTRLGLPAPAYKTGKLALNPDEASHIIDFLTSKSHQVVDSALTGLNVFLRASGASTRDQDVEGFWDRFEKTFGGLSMQGRPRSKWFLALRDGLKADVDACQRQWNTLMATGMQYYRENVGHVYATWRAIEPHFPKGNESDSSNMARQFLVEDSSTVQEFNRWELLKASWAFKFHHKRRFVWQMAGRQLQAIKAMARRKDEELSPEEAVPVPVVSNMYAALKPDNTFIKRLLAMDDDDDGDDVG